MECYYHPDREGTDKCAICGKSICKECGLEIAGKVYCEECLEKIVGLETSQQTEQAIDPVVEQEPIVTEPVEIAADDNIYQLQEEEIDIEVPSATQEEANQEYKIISDDSPYNIKDSIKYSGGLESSYLDDSEKVYPEPQIEEPQVAQNELNTQEKETLTQKDDDDFIYPDHDFEPQSTSARQDLEDKYEKYLDDLYFDETDIPLGEQLAKDEEQYGSLTRKEYTPKKQEAVEQKLPAEEKAPKEETPEEMEARIRAEILKEQNLMTDEEEADKTIHNLSYNDGKEPMGILDIILTIILIIVILIVLYYVLYLFLLNSSYPTFMDAVFALRNPQNVINAILTH